MVLTSIDYYLNGFFDFQWWNNRNFVSNRAMLCRSQASMTAESLVEPIGAAMKPTPLWSKYWIRISSRNIYTNEKKLTWWARAMLSWKGKKASELNATPFNRPIQSHFSSGLNGMGTCSKRASHEGRSSIITDQNNT